MIGYYYFAQSKIGSWVIPLRHHSLLSLGSDISLHFVVFFHILKILYNCNQKK